MVCHATGRQFEANIAFFPTQEVLKGQILTCRKISQDMRPIYTIITVDHWAHDPEENLRQSRIPNHLNHKTKTILTQFSTSSNWAVSFENPSALPLYFPVQT